MNLPRFGRLVPSFAVLLALAVTTRSTAGQDPDADLRMPESWDAFTAHLSDGGDFGVWEATGVTTDVWKTLPAGLPYRYRARTTLEESGRLVVRSFTYVGKDGALLSSGSETIVWDAKKKRPIWSVSGFDGDRPWSDSGWLVGYDQTRLVVASEETAEGETYELRTTIERIDKNTRRRTIARADGRGTPFVQDFTRVNHLVEALDGWDPTGTWVTRMGDVEFVNMSTWGAGRRCVVIVEGVRTAGGELEVTGNGLMWFDQDARVIRQRYVTEMGLVLEGEVVTVVRERLEMRFTGTDADGVSLHAVVTSEMDGDVMTSRFSHMTYDGWARTPAWAEGPMTARRER